ncbi:MAG: hypothetical protein R2911_09450 [Caldilineaceae bacterium]
MPKSPIDILLIEHPRRWLTIIVAAYLIVATLFALYTPPWQNPDEPRHYNLLRTLRKGPWSCPFYRWAIMTRRCRWPDRPEIPAGTLDRRCIMRKWYQPPLYYLTAIRSSGWGGRWVCAAAAGCGCMMCCWKRFRCCCFTAMFAWPFRRGRLWRWRQLAFTALLPMHVAMRNAAVNNDGLAELLLLAAMLTAALDDRGWVAARRARARCCGLACWGWGC